MEQAAQGDGSYEEVLHFLEQQAKEKGLTRWLDTNLAKLNP
jgi:hypothetical protein